MWDFLAATWNYIGSYNLFGIRVNIIMMSSLLTADYEEMYIIRRVKGKNIVL